MFWFGDLYDDLYNDSYDPYCDFRGPNRRNWAEKSEAALKREREAKEIFHNQFLPQAKQATSFPFNVAGLIEPTLHLTNPCWRDFKKEVAKYGCTAKRRVVTPTEIAYMHKSKVRKTKMYWIDVTIASHPDRALEAIKENKEKAEQAKRKKEEKAKKLAEQRRLKMEEDRQKEAAIKVLVDKEYEEVVKTIHGDSSPIEAYSKKRSLEDAKPSTGPKQTKEQDVLPSPTKKLKVSPTCTTFNITAPIPRLLNKADSKHSETIDQIKEQIRKEKSDEEKKILDKLHQKMKVIEEKRVKEAEEYRDAIKNAIQGIKPTATLVQAKVLAPKIDNLMKVDVASIPQ